MEISLHTTTTLTRGLSKKIAIVTNCCDDWGGSEELWALSIPHLQLEGADITVLKDKINRSHPRYAALSAKGVRLVELDILRKSSRAVRGILKVWNKLNRVQNHLQSRFEKFLSSQHPDLVVISQGINFDGLIYAHSCAMRSIPYVIVSQKAVEFYWPPEGEREFMRNAFLNAKKCFFVSNSNQQLTEEQFGLRFRNAQLIRNPVRIPIQQIPYPKTENGFRLACVARLFVIDKGQDILLRIMSQPKWRKRQLTIALVGKGVDENGLKAMANLLEVRRVEFIGEVQDMQKLWRHYHALVLPSRSEGLPLVVLEAMAAGRTVIATKAGGTQEIVDDSETGFIGEATLESFEATMERAWNRRDEWEQMGKKALTQISRNVPSNPEIDFVKALTQILYEE